MYNSISSKVLEPDLTILSNQLIYSEIALWAVS